MHMWDDGRIQEEQGLYSFQLRNKSHGFIFGRLDFYLTCMSVKGNKNSPYTSVWFILDLRLSAQGWGTIHTYSPQSRQAEIWFHSQHNWTNMPVHHGGNGPAVNTLPISLNKERSLDFTIPFRGWSWCRIAMCCSLLWAVSLGHNLVYSFLVSEHLSLVMLSFQLPVCKQLIWFSHITVLSFPY